jgi:hypothetical protein
MTFPDYDGHGAGFSCDQSHQASGRNLGHPKPTKGFAPRTGGETYLDRVPHETELTSSRMVTVGPYCLPPTKINPLVRSALSVTIQRVWDGASK